VSSFSPPIGFIAGNQQLPVLAAQKVKERGDSLVVVGLRGETEPELKTLADHYLETPLGQLDAMAKFFLAHKVQKVCLAGGVSRDNIINSYDPDEEAVKVMEKLTNFQTDTILRAVGDYLESLGLQLVSVTDIVPEIRIKPGVLTQKSPDDEQLEDLKLAFHLAKELGRLDCGQTVVVSDKIAVALEGADGTDATIRRGAGLCRKPISVAKVVKPSQDTRLDLPVIGLKTIETLVECKAGALALDAGGLIMLQSRRCLELADQSNLAIVAWLDLPLADEPNDR
jgi:DUF1009 family protein